MLQWSWKRKYVQL